MAKEAAPGLLKHARNSKKAMETPRGYSVCKNIRYRCTKQVGYDGKTCDSVVDTAKGFKKLANDAKLPKLVKVAETVHDPRSVKCTEFRIRRRNLAELVLGGVRGLGDDAAAVDGEEEEGAPGADHGDESKGARGWLAGSLRAVKEAMCPSSGPVAASTWVPLHAAVGAFVCPFIEGTRP